ncbi:MAG: cell division protein FtsQ/DivIB [Nitrosomonadaceae bacterium]
MWDNYRVLNILANCLFTLVVLAAAAAISPSVINLPIFALKEVSITGTNKTDGRFKYITREQINSLISSQIAGSFFTVELDTISNTFEKLPWVRAASVRRHWPHGLEVRLEEHVVLARRGSSELINIYGEVFTATTNKRLPEFTGPVERSYEVSQQYVIFRKLLQPLQKNIVQLDFSPRRAWRIHMEDGVVLELGREQVETRLGLYVLAHDHIASQFKEQVTYVDLRYPNGFSVRAVDSVQKKLHDQVLKKTG